ncbi:glutathione S-transferase family protein [Methylocella sp.]|uniref:glutathione S-transferase family protein n=1 Tax=Methylocella sp. TaxID=1978226 RepID=UPI0035B0C112
MGLLVDGVWRDQWYDTNSHGGRFERDAAKFRNWITRDGAPGPTGEGGFKAEPGRYHLYGAYFCPWAHRALIFRKLKGLEEIVGLSIVNWLMREEGLTFAPADGVIGDPNLGARRLYEVYLAANPHYSGRATVPTLWDKERRTIVSTESADIIRMFNGAFDPVGAKAGDYYPPALREEIDALNARIYPTLNNGVYRAGFATSQSAYEEAIGPLFETLDVLEERLSRRRYLCGAAITEADVRLLTTLLRFDIVYVGHFKCNVRRIADYPNLWGYVRDLLTLDAVASTFRPDHIKRHYYESHLTINPTGIVPVGPQVDFFAPQDRARLG